VSNLSHIGERGEARMVDVSEKADTARVARASGVIVMSREALDAVVENRMKKGDVFSAARLAGIMAAKRTAELIPLCHNIALTDVSIDIEVDESLPGLIVNSTAASVGKTGVEMEALTSVAVALLTIYDMAKSIDRGMIIRDIGLVEKSGGKSGDWKRA
jgi:cyclic pyranopterin phosphate synthase